MSAVQSMAATEKQPPVAAGADAGTDHDARRLLLTFMIGAEHMAIDVVHVSEVLSRLPTTRMPHADPMAPALTNVRGSVVPVIDLRHRLGLPPSREEPGKLLVLALTIEGESLRIAVEADDVDRIIELPAEAVEAVPTLGLGLPRQYVEGVIRNDGEPLFLVQPNTLFDPSAACRRPDSL
ncbi:MAG: chemotaxis protein CheW [Pseudomonadota bacterium]